MPTTPHFEIRRDSVDVTLGGIFSVDADTHRGYVAGPARFFVDGREVTQAEYHRRLEQHAEELRSRNG